MVLRRPQPPPSNRDDSPELGNPLKLTQYNKKTGRPIRKSAGKAMKGDGYVDSGMLEEEDFLPLTSEESEDDDEMEQRSHLQKSKRKRKRSPSPPSPHLEPILYDQDLEQLTDNEQGGAFHHHTPKKQPVTLQFNVPLGFHGPLFVKLDSTLLHQNEEGRLHEMQPGKTKTARMDSLAPSQSAPQVHRKGFTCLPPELRNTVYRHLFARKDQDIKIPPSKDGPALCRSAQFLRTCKLVHNEGCSVLYGENTFIFARHYATRGPFWEKVPKEIGYQDVLHFLKMIGPENLQYLRDIKFKFDDACPRDTPYLDSNEKRRFLNDEYLMNCLRILRGAKLRTLSMRFIGRRAIVKSDVKFLGYLEQIKADEVEQMLDTWYYPPQKIPSYVWNDLKALMTRKKKLYEKE
ncbi:Nn.00g109490.m01.CDS01 [Neocucurbitaria sp. VM-36]